MDYKIVQIVTGVYQTKDKRNSHMLYALNAEGMVLKHTKGGWVVIYDPQETPLDDTSYPDDDIPF